VARSWNWLARMKSDGLAGSGFFSWRSPTKRWWQEVWNGRHLFWNGWVARKTLVDGWAGKLLLQAVLDSFFLQIQFQTLILLNSLSSSLL